MDFCGRKIALSKCEKTTINSTDNKCNGGSEMAKMKKKINKNRMNKKSVQAKQVFTGLKHDMQQLMAEENYVDAIDVMAEMATNRQMDGEVMYWGAQCYFMTGDFERAERWAGNALNNGYNSAGIKILLANLCVAEERYEDAFKLCEVALSEGVDSMTGLDKEIFDDLMDNIRYGYDELMAKYPLVSEYFEKNDSASQTVFSQLSEAETEKPDIKQPADNGVKTEEEDNADKAQAALARLRQLLSKNKAADEAEEAPKEESAEQQAEPTITREVIASDDVAEDKDIQPEIQQTEAEQPAVEAKTVKQSEENSAEQNNNDEFDVAGTLEQVVAKEISLAEKVRLINVFAAACYQREDYQSAFDLLSAALEIDGQDAATLKNIAYTCLSAGETEQALSFAAQLPVVDFGLLYALK